MRDIERLRSVPVLTRLLKLPTQVVPGPYVEPLSDAETGGELCQQPANEEFVWHTC